jgi:N-acetyl sugar amidotransferase
MTIHHDELGKSKQGLRWCSNCLAMSTRNRITFDERGWCNACVWTEKKKIIDWNARERELETLLARHRRDDGNFDCLVPVSGGKDGSYVAYCLRHRYNMNPLCLTVTPPLPLALGDQNLRAFVESGYSHISVNPPQEAMRALNKVGLIEMGFPYYGWLTAIHTTPVRMAQQLDIKLIVYGEDGEVEYGGCSETEKVSTFDVGYMKRIYLEGGHEDVLFKADLDRNEKYFFEFPNERKLEYMSIDITHWSYFESWDPYRNYLVAKEKCGLKESEISNTGTFTNFAQNDQALYALHTYLMYLKYGFGRANQDACIEVRRGAMLRKQALNLIRLYDGQYPHEYVQTYLEYYRMSRSEFDEVLDKWANKSLFQKKGNMWQPDFEIE